MNYDNNTSLMISPELSAEQLGAYMEGNLTDTERANVEAILSNDPQAAQLYTDVNETLIDWDAKIYDEYPDFDNTFEMQEIDTQDYETYHDTSTTDKPYEAAYEDFEEDTFDEANENDIDEEPTSIIDEDHLESPSQPSPTVLEIDETEIAGAGHEETINTDGADDITF